MLFSWREIAGVLVFFVGAVLLGSILVAAVGVIPPPRMSPQVQVVPQPEPCVEAPCCERCRCGR